MRKIFGGAMLFSAVGATILGGALAWQDTQITDFEQVDVGTVSFAIDYTEAPGQLLGPNDDSPNLVGGGLISNTGTLNLYWVGGQVGMAGTSNNATCNASNFVGTVTPLADLAFGGELSAGELGQQGFQVDIAVKSSAPEACMGETLTYTVAVTMGTQPVN